MLPSFKEHFGLVLTCENRRMLFVPEGFAHGFLTLSDNTEVFYYMSEFYSPEPERGFRWDDPTFGIDWPSEVSIVSDRDGTIRDFGLSDREMP